MKKTILSLLLLNAICTYSNAQAIADCKNTCEKTTVVQEGVFLGVQITNGPTGKNASIMQVFDGTAAKENNLTVDDIIVSVDNEEVQNNQHLVTIIGKHKANDRVLLKYLHNNVMVAKKVTLGAKRTYLQKEIVCCDEAVVNNLSIYPNPASESINVSLVNETTQPVTLRIFDLTGKEVAKMDFDKDVNLSNYSLSNLINGEYLVNVSNGKINKTERFIKVTK